MRDATNPVHYSLANVFDLPGFTETRQRQRIAELCHALRQTRSLGILAGLPGVGKTWAVQQVAQTEPEPQEYFSSPVLYTTADVKSNAKALLANLLTCLGPDYRAPVVDMTRLACCWIHRRMVELIIVDDAARLDRDAWAIVQDIHDRTHCAFLFVGPPDLPQRLRKRPALHNRLSLSIEMVPLTFDELYAFVRQWQQKRPQQDYWSGCAAEFFVADGGDSEDIAIMKELYRVTLGNLRRVHQFIEQAERVATVNGHAYVQLETARAVAALFASYHE